MSQITITQQKKEELIENFRQTLKISEEMLPYACQISYEIQDKFVKIEKTELMKFILEIGACLPFQGKNHGEWNIFLENAWECLKDENAVDLSQAKKMILRGNEFFPKISEIVQAIDTAREIRQEFGRKIYSAIAMGG